MHAKLTNTLATIYRRQPFEKIARSDLTGSARIASATAMELETILFIRCSLTESEQTPIALPQREAI
jgi:hypothetical protein